MKRIKMQSMLFFILFGIMLLGNQAYAYKALSVEALYQNEQNMEIKITAKNFDGIDGFDIYRSESKNGKYESVASIDIVENNWNITYPWEEERKTYSINDQFQFEQNKLYYYKISAYKNSGNSKKYVETLETNVIAWGEKTQISYVKRKGKLAAKIKWKKVKDADGYLIYQIKDYDDEGEYCYPAIEDFSKYTLIKTIKNTKTCTATFKNLKNGITYTYRVCAYKKINGKRVIGTYSEAEAVTMDYYAYETENYEQKVKRAFGSEKKKRKNFKTANRAEKQMTEIKIKVWDYQSGKSGTKITKEKSLTVNKNLAPTIKQMFKEIYQSKEKQVIHDIGCYSYRIGEHMYGLAIDVNVNENYMIDGKKILCGSYWKPKKDPYSISNNSEFVKIMKRYGFSRGIWGTRRDYMHFSYFGT